MPGISMRVLTTLGQLKQNPKYLLLFSAWMYHDIFRCDMVAHQRNIRDAKIKNQAFSWLGKYGRIFSWSLHQLPAVDRVATRTCWAAMQFNQQWRTTAWQRSHDCDNSTGLMKIPGNFTDFSGGKSRRFGTFWTSGVLLSEQIMKYEQLTEAPIHRQVLPCRNWGVVWLKCIAIRFPAVFRPCHQTAVP